MPINKKYFYGQQKIEENDIRMAISALKSDLLSQGPKLNEFEAKVAEYCGVNYCVAVSNGTAALHMACWALELDTGDFGWTSPLSFVASANCIRYCGAGVDFVDIDSETFNLSPANLEEKFKQAGAKNRLPKVIIPVHFAGQTCDMRKIRDIADQYGCRVIEDACQALGGEYKDKKIGCCKYSDITVFSLHPVKSITTGEGGLILTNSMELYKKMKLMRAHGIVRGDDLRDNMIGPWHAEMHSEGYNYKITDFQCALGISQMEKLDDFVEYRQLLADQYKRLLCDVPVRFQTPFNQARSAWHLMVLLIDFEKVHITKRQFFDDMKKRNINLSVHYYPIHLNPFYRQLGFIEGMFPEAERYYEKAFTFPLHPGLDHADITFICEQVKQILST